MRYVVSDPTLHRHIAICLTQKRFIHSSLKHTLYEKQLYPDLYQELAAAAVEAWRSNLSPDTNFREIRNLCSRRIYAFLKNNGFSRHWDPKTRKQGKGFLDRELVKPLEVEKRTIKSQAATESNIIRQAQEIVEKKINREAWQKVWTWTNSRQSAPRGEAAEAVNLLKKELKKYDIYI